MKYKRGDIMSKEIRQFVLYKAVLSKSGAILLPAMLPTYGIFEFEEKTKVLKKVTTYDLDGTEVPLTFSQVRNSTSDIPFATIKDVEEEIERLRVIERFLPKLTPLEDTSAFNNLFAKEAVLLTQLRTLRQFEIVLKHFEP